MTNIYFKHIVTLFILSILLIIDIITPLGVAVGIIYVVFMLLVLWYKHPFYPIYFSVISTVFILLGWKLSPPGGEFWIVFFNRLMSIIVMWFIGLTIFYYLKSKKNLNKQINKNFGINHANTFLKKIITSINSNIIVIEPNGTILISNSCAFFDEYNINSEKLEFNHLISKNYFELLKNKLKDESLYYIIKNGVNSVVSNSSNCFDCKFNLNINNTIKYYKLEASLYDSDGKIVINQTDITDLELNIKKINEITHDLESIINNISEVVYKTNISAERKSKPEYISNNIVEVLGITKDEYFKNNATITIYIKPIYLEKAKLFNDNLFKATNSIPHTIEYEWYHSIKKKWIWINETIVPEIIDGKIVGIYGTVSDITIRKNLEADTLKTIIQTEEKERQRLAHDLHDGLGQNIAAANMYFNSLSDLVLNKLSNEDKEVYLTGKKLLNEATLETRLVSHNIMPRSLEQFGLERSVYELLNNYQLLHKKIRFNLNSNLSEKRLQKSIELASFRCIQELISNAIKHSKGTQIDINLFLSKNRFKIYIKDNGVGFDINVLKLKERGGIGLLNIPKRISIFGGEFIINSDEKGTHIIISFPKALFE